MFNLLASGTRASSPVDSQCRQNTRVYKITRGSSLSPSSGQTPESATATERTELGA